MTPIEPTARRILIFVTAVLFALFCGCSETKTSVQLRRGPTFSLRGSGQLASFRVYAPQRGRKIATPFDTKSLAWSVQPSDGYFKGARIERMLFDYGKVPVGYVQTVPNIGAAPRLASHLVYYFYAETTNAPAAEGFFYLDGDVPTDIAVPGLCQSGFSGDVKPLKCGTSDPYTEPADLEQFVEQHRISR